MFTISLLHTYVRHMHSPSLVRTVCSPHSLYFHVFAFFSHLSALQLGRYTLCFPSGLCDLSTPSFFYPWCILFTLLFVVWMVVDTSYNSECDSFAFLSHLFAQPLGRYTLCFPSGLCDLSTPSFFYPLRVLFTLHAVSSGWL
jgi:hypothetical protein